MRALIVVRQVHLKRDGGGYRVMLVDLWDDQALANAYCMSSKRRFAVFLRFQYGFA
jgi:hypothetical protein